MDFTFSLCTGVISNVDVLVPHHGTVEVVNRSGKGVTTPGDVLLHFVAHPGLPLGLHLLLLPGGQVRHHLPPQGGRHLKKQLSLNFSKFFEKIEE